MFLTLPHVAPGGAIAAVMRYLTGAGRALMARLYVLASVTFLPGALALGHVITKGALG